MEQSLNAIGPISSVFGATFGRNQRRRARSNLRDAVPSKTCERPPNTNGKSRGGIKFQPQRPHGRRGGEVGRITATARGLNGFGESNTDSVDKFCVPPRRVRHAVTNLLRNRLPRYGFGDAARGSRLGRRAPWGRSVHSAGMRQTCKYSVESSMLTKGRTRG